MARIFQERIPDRPQVIDPLGRLRLQRPKDHGGRSWRDRREWLAKKRTYKLRWRAELVRQALRPKPPQAPLDPSLQMFVDGVRRRPVE